MSLRKENGLTLLTLVITVIVAAILAVVTIDLAVSSDTVGKAKSLDMRVDMTEIVETWHTRRAVFEMQGISAENMNYDDIKNATIFIGESTYKEKLIDTTEISDILNSKIKIKKGEIVYIPSKCSESEKKYFKEQNILSEDEI